jgi:hypothetical protein
MRLGDCEMRIDVDDTTLAEHEAAHAVMRKLRGLRLTALTLNEGGGLRQHQTEKLAQGKRIGRPPRDRK